ERLASKEQEKPLLIAMIEDLLRYEIALRDDEGRYLIFPSQATCQYPDLANLKGYYAVFRFEGPVLSIYTTLAVRLALSGMFEVKDLWKNVIIYRPIGEDTCGMSLRTISEGRGELTLFFDKAVDKQMRFAFEKFVQKHLQLHAMPESIERQRLFTCLNC